MQLPFQKLLNPPASGKCCLVLDVDYTLFDHLWHLQVKEEFKKDKSQIIPEFQRPYLHQFLQTCYEKYDLVIWSATGFVAIDSKLSNLGIYSHPNYKITLGTLLFIFFSSVRGSKILSLFVSALLLHWKRLILKFDVMVNPSFFFVARTHVCFVSFSATFFAAAL
jgi:hypothetical protein